MLVLKNKKQALFLSLDTITTAAAQMTFLLLAAALVNGVIGGELKITSVEGLIQFKGNVNSGTNYSGTTVFLDSDLSFTGKTFEPIGNESNYFCGVFDGQGHVISNLKMNSTSRFVGLFGYSKGLTIKNVILDSSCSITSSFSDSGYARIGWIIGHCYTRNEACTIENSVNIGSVTFRGSISGSNGNLYLGGIAGWIYSSNLDSTVKNCANYGDVTHSGTSSSSYIGGVVGRSDGSSSKRVYIYNSLNHGTITHSGTTTDYLYLGGIIGWTYYTTIENCVSGGKISSITNASSDNYIGSIVGWVSSYTSINYAYFTSDLSGYNKYGYIKNSPISESNTLSYDSTSFELSETVSIGSYSGTSLIDVLNAAADYYTLRDYSHWLLNKGSNAVSFTINGRTNPIKMNYQIILLPSLASDGDMSFDGWYTDNGLITPLTEFEVTSEAELYGKFEDNTNSYTISFDTRREGVSIAPITAPFGYAVSLQSESVGEKYVIALWETEYGDNVGLSLNMPSHNITLYAVWKCTHIETPEDFIDFSKIVNKGVDSFTGTTVFLDSDLSLAGKSFEPIGIDYYNYFNGTFDGRGHVISNLAMNSSSEYVGLFGFSKGLIIENVILDSSCFITSSYSSGHACNGGIIGRCWADNGPCIIENNVNMGSVTFSGDISSSYGSLYLGGIACEFYSSSGYDSTVKNCANYGDVTHSGTSSDSYIGGIVGWSYGYSSNKVYIYNSLNHGTITHSGTTSSNLYLGGIAGYTECTTIENCVSGGKFSLFTTASSDNYIGSIVGYIWGDTSINYAYFTSDLSGYNKYGYIKNSPISESNTLSYDSTAFELNVTVSIGNYSGNFLIGALNAAADYYTLRDYSHWLLNKGNNVVAFTINGRTNPIKMNYQIILLPSLASEGNMRFDGWYTDEGLTTPLTEFEVTSETELYGKYFCLNFTVTLDVNGGDELPLKEMTIGCDRVYGDLPAPTPTRTGHTFLGWFTERVGGEKVESGAKVATFSNHTLFAHWTINNYTVTFNPSGGNTSQSTKVVTFGSAYGDLPTPNRTGHTFLGWFSEKNESITEESIVKIPDNHTLCAQWLEITQGQVEIVFSTKDMSEEEIEEVIRKYTDADFKITVIESGDDEIRVIVEFVDAEKADEFFRRVNAVIKRGEVSLIKRVDFVQEGTPSFSSAHLPMSLLCLI